MFFYRDLRYYYTTLRKQLHFRPIAPYIPSLKWQGFTAHFDNTNLQIYSKHVINGEYKLELWLFFSPSGESERDSSQFFGETS